MQPAIMLVTTAVIAMLFALANSQINTNNVLNGATAGVGGAGAGVPAGTITRTQTNQILAVLNSPAVTGGGGATQSTTTTANGAGAVAVGGAQTQTQIFMQSQSGTFTAMLVRQLTSLGVGGLGTDFCYIDVINSVSQQSVWESPCQAVSTTSPCVLQLTDDGFSITDTNNEIWNNGADSSYVSVVLLENGDLQMLDQTANIVWAGTQNPLVNQNCGSVLSPGSPPFINPPFSSPLQAQLPNGQSLFSQPFAASNPLVSSAMGCSSPSLFTMALVGVFLGFPLFIVREVCP